MKIQQLKQIAIRSIAAVSLVAPLAVGLVAAPAFAQQANNPFVQGQTLANSVAGSAGISSQQSLPTIIGQIINIGLTLLGMVFLILILYAGFLWMTAQGEGKQVEKAKEILKQSIIGLIVIVAGFAISNFVLASLVNVTQS